jgi:hypothetical protein
MSQAGLLRIQTGVLPPSVPTSFVTNAGTAVPALGILNVLGTTSASGSIPFEFTGSGNTVTGVIQRSQAIASTDATKIGLASFNSAQFTVDANGFVSTINNGTITSVTTSNATPQFVLTGTTENIDFGITNLLLGSSGSAITSGSQNVGTGLNSLVAVTSGNGNTATGFQSAFQISTGSGNTAIGAGALHLGNTSGNTCVGQSAGSVLNGNNNTCLGALVLPSGLTRNIAIGYAAANSYGGTESNNIIIGNSGKVGESNVLRIGTTGSGSGQVDIAFVAAITGVTVSASAPVAVDTNGQLSSLGFGTATQVFTSNGPGVSPTWQAAGGGGSSTSFSVAMTTPQTLAQNALVKVTYDTALIDTASGYSSGVYTVPTTGNWMLSVVGNFSTAVSFIDCDVFINKNSGTYLLHLQPSTPSDGITTNNGSGSGVFPLVAGDTIQISVFAQTTGAVNLTANGVSNGYFNIFSGYKLP